MALKNKQKKMSTETAIWVQTAWTLDAVVTR